MKQKLSLWLAGIFILAACHDNKDNGPNASVTQAFQAKYPHATQVKWEKKNSYMTADFVLEQHSRTAWFDENGQWYMTETELDHLHQLPEQVQAGFAGSEYAHWTTDDIDQLERLDAETIYVIEVKKEKQEYDLYFSADGILIKAIPADDQDDYKDYLPAENLPVKITEFIEKYYPGARIVEKETERGITEIELIHDNRNKEVVFDAKGEWINTHYDILRKEVTEVVMQTLLNSAYKDYLIDDIEKYETPGGIYYLFELEKGNQDIQIKINEEGKIL